MKRVHEKVNGVFDFAELGFFCYESKLESANWSKRKGISEVLLIDTLDQ